METDLFVRAYAPTDEDDRARHYATVIRCYKVIKEFMRLEDVSDSLKESFQSWLAEEHHIAEKDIALEVVFNEIGTPLTDNMLDKCMKNIHARHVSHGRHQQ